MEKPSEKLLLDPHSARRAKKDGFLNVLKAQNSSNVEGKIIGQIGNNFYNKMIQKF